MNEIDVRFKVEELKFIKSFIGKKLMNYSHEPFVFTNTVSQLVSFNIENEDYYLYSFTEEIDYFGTNEEVALWSFENVKYPFVDNKELMSNTVNQIIKRIFLVQENQRLYRNSEQIYNVWLTRGIIFDMGECQISFEKGEWLMENIIVRKGYNLAETYSPVTAFTERWNDTVKAECSREIIEIC